MLVSIRRRRRGSRNESAHSSLKKSLVEQKKKDVPGARDIASRACLSWLLVGICPRRRGFRMPLVVMTYRLARHECYWSSHGCEVVVYKYKVKFK